jgi:predicted nucleic acid-binding Zn finger protein
MGKQIDYEKMGDNTFKAAKLLIKNVLMVQEDEYISKLRYSAPKHFLKEFGTVKVCGPRRSGHSSCIPSIIFKYRLNPLVTYNLMNMRNRIVGDCVDSVKGMKTFGSEVFIRSFKNAQCVYCYEGVENDYVINFSSINCLFSGSLNGLSCDSIIVDTASMLKSDQIESVYDFMVAQMKFIPIESHPLVIFLE